MVSWSLQPIFLRGVFSCGLGCRAHGCVQGAPIPTVEKSAGEHSVLYAVVLLGGPLARGPRLGFPAPSWALAWAACGPSALHQHQEHARHCGPGPARSAGVGVGPGGPGRVGGVSVAGGLWLSPGLHSLSCCPCLLIFVSYISSTASASWPIQAHALGFCLRHELTTSRGRSQVKLLSGTVWPQSFPTSPEISECPLGPDIDAHCRGSHGAWERAVFSQ